ncbi:ATP-binding protein [Pseudomonas entomophila]|uniref:ATP-binding protein n=1 Tax=Pseudomonas entomophila TaxID=312306 RepID=UPI003EBB88EA
MTLAPAYTFLDFPGEMARLMREKEWSQTPFGPLEGWSQALRSAVSICLGSRFPMVLYWGETRALIYNDAWSPVPGRKHPAALGSPGPEVWAEIWDIIGPMFDHVMNTGEATWSEDQLLPLNRFGYTEECYFYYSYSPVRGEDGRVEGIFTAVTETTYRVLATRRERLLRQVAEATAQTRTPADACQAMARLLHGVPQEAPFVLVYLADPTSGGYRRVAIEGCAAADDLAPAVILPGEHVTPWPLHSALDAPVPVEGLASRYPGRLSGQPWPEPLEQALVVPVPSARAGVPYGFLILGISPRRRIDPDYITLFQRAAGHVSTALSNIERYEEERRRSEELAELDRAKTVFFSNASHEFRTPLTLMLGPLEDMLGQHTETPGQLTVARESLHLVHRNGQRLLRLVNTLLDFSRIEAGRVRADFMPVDLSAFTAELASSFRSAMTRAGLAYHIDCDVLGEAVWIDQEMWEKIVLNLISNAFKYTLSGQVSVHLARVPEGARLQVRDTGVGIPQQELERIFDRFHRIEGQIGRTHEGTGIGLALVKDLTRLHGGQVGVRSEIGVGTCFEVLLPFGNAHLPARKVQGNALTSTAIHADTFVAEALRWLPEPGGDALPMDERTAGQAKPSNGLHILLADDNADMRGYVQRLLTEAGFAVTAVADGREAVDQARRVRPDLVLSDIMMPVLDGFGVIRALRDDPATHELPIILLSARAGEEASIEGIAAGADDYLVKPFSARELIARVDGALRLAKLRQESAAALRQANEVLESRVRERTRERDQVWAFSHDMIGIADLEGVWLSVNPAWTRVLGWPAEQIVGKTSAWLEHPDDSTRTREEIQALAIGAPTFNFENRFRTRLGSYRTLNWTAVPEGGLLYCVARDVTVERDRLAELEQAKDALRQSQKMEAIGQLTGGIAHDFNNLLTGIMGSMEMLQRHALPEHPRAQRHIGNAIVSAQRAAALTQRLLSFSRRQALDMRPVDVNRLITGMEFLLQRTVTENIQVERVLQPEAWTVHTDANQLENVLLNLCINARDAMGETGRLRICTRNVVRSGPVTSDGPLAGDYLSLEVSDTGEGIAPDLLDKVFEPFFTTKPQGKGTGLGLSMVYGFVKQTGGHVEVQSTPGQGTCMTVLLPRHQGTLAGPASELPAAASVLKTGTGERVLLVEDEPSVRLVVTELLTEAGYHVAEAEDAQAALALVDREPAFDLMVSDVGLPGLSGRELADRVRSRQPTIKVLLITGYAKDAGNLRHFLGEGMHILQKPFSVEALAMKVRDVLHAT